MKGLDRELMMYREEAEFPMIRHPLVYAVPFFEHPTEVDRLNKMLASKKEAVQSALDAHRWTEYVFLHERPHRILAFMEIHPEIDNDVYWPLLRDIWTDSENIYQNHMVWWEMLSSPRDRRALFTAAEDRGTLKKLPNELFIYRGTQKIEMDGHYLGFSWTLDPGRAAWFATRLHKPSEGSAVVASAQVHKKYIVGFIDGRGEREIVVEPKELEQLAWEAVE